VKVLDEWQCPNCERTEYVDVDEYLTIGLPMCTQCGGFFEMERISDQSLIIE
jgi:transcription elongation factor Elf1